MEGNEMIYHATSRLRRHHKFSGTRLNIQLFIGFQLSVVAVK